MAKSKLNGSGKIGLANSYKAYTLRNAKSIPQVQHLPEDIRNAMRVVGHVLPFKANKYVVNELIDWDNIPEDPIFRLTFPQKDMLKPEHYVEMDRILKSGADKAELKQAADKIRWQLNPHPAGQVHLNKPTLSNGTRLDGMQHKYRETVLFFPSHGQTCHAYCTFCFRWPQFVGIDELKFAMKESELLVQYIKEHPEVTDVLFTGGDPMIMKAKVLSTYIKPLLDADIPNLRTIRIGTKALSYWPYKFTTDNDADDVIRLFENITDAGIHLALMAHFSHKVELKTPAVQKALIRIRNTGAEVRSQSPLLRGINDTSEAWSEMWKEQVRQGIIPYYMFVVRNTGAQHFFDIPLEKTWDIFRGAYQNISGIGRTVRGPSMSAKPGKVQILGITEVMGEKVFVLRMIQGRNPDWVQRPFFARYNPDAVWLDDLEPAFGENQFFYEDELEAMYKSVPDEQINTGKEDLMIAG
ncbi:MAG: KamA family radical SAM protein [Cyclonatronaceae bacterium]